MTHYHAGNREMQTHFDTRRLADRLDDVIVNEEVSASDAEFIASVDNFFLATVSSDGLPRSATKAVHLAS